MAMKAAIAKRASLENMVLNEWEGLGLQGSGIRDKDEVGCSTGEFTTSLYRFVFFFDSRFGPRRRRVYW